MRNGLVISMLLVLLASAARAQDTQAPLSIDMGVAERVRPSHLGARSSVFDTVPVVNIKLGEVLSVSLDDGVHWTALRTANWSAGPVLEYRQSYSDHLPSGSFQMADAVEAGLFVKRVTPIGDAEFRLRRALNSYQGWSADLSLDTGFMALDHLFLGAEPHIAWADDQFSKEYFGLWTKGKASLSSAGDPVRPFRSIGMALLARYELQPMTSIGLIVSEDHRVGAMTGSSLFQARNNFEGSIGLTRRFR
jgi:outer membrane scaffolding protein for murein synthesis (MipA/OmpV family)